jgi:hypothetical protein
MRRVRLGGTLLAIAVGVVLLLLAGDLRAWRNTLNQASLRYDSSPLAPVQLTPETALPAGLSGRLLAVSSDQRWLEALRTFAYVYKTTTNLDALGPGDLTLLNGSEAELSPLTQDANAVRASQAYDLIAVVMFREAYPGEGVDTGMISDAVLDLQNAVTLDPANELAKENLELALRVAYATHAAVHIAVGAGNHAAPRRQGGTDGPPGEGY